VAGRIDDAVDRRAGALPGDAEGVSAGKQRSKVARASSDHDRSAAHSRLSVIIRQNPLQEIFINAAGMD
jgi:hypothetical protein